MTRVCFSQAIVCFDFFETKNSIHAARRSCNSRLMTVHGVCVMVNRMHAHNKLKYSAIAYMYILSSQVFCYVIRVCCAVLSPIRSGETGRITVFLCVWQMSEVLDILRVTQRRIISVYWHFGVLLKRLSIRTRLKMSYLEDLLKNIRNLEHMIDLVLVAGKDGRK